MKNHPLRSLGSSRQNYEESKKREIRVADPKRAPGGSRTQASYPDYLGWETAGRTEVALKHPLGAGVLCGEIKGFPNTSE